MKIKVGVGVLLLLAILTSALPIMAVRSSQHPPRLQRIVSIVRKARR